MQILLDQLLKRHGTDAEQRKRCFAVCRPQQKDFVSLVQWFGNEKVLSTSFEIEQYNTDHQLIPYNKDMYGIYAHQGYKLYSEQGGHLNTNFNGERHTLGQPIGIIKFRRDEYSRAKDEYDKFWEWREHRNPDRLKMEEQFSFDGKHAMHLVRLLRMGEEILRTGEVLVKRPDAKELLAIRNGAWTYEDLVAYAESKDHTIREELYKSTALPKKPNIKFAAELLMHAQDTVWNG